MTEIVDERPDAEKDADLMMHAQEIAELLIRAVSPGNFRLIRAALNAALALLPAPSSRLQTPAAAQGWQAERKKLTDQVWALELRNRQLDGWRVRALAAEDQVDALEERAEAAAPPSPAAQKQEKGEQT